METSERDEVKLLFGPGLSLFTLARISGVPSAGLESCADSNYCIRYVGHRVLKVVQLRNRFQGQEAWAETFAVFIITHTTDPSLGFPLAETIRLHWAIQQLQSSSI